MQIRKNGPLPLSTSEEQFNEAFNCMNDMMMSHEQKINELQTRVLNLQGQQTKNVTQSDFSRQFDQETKGFKLSIKEEITKLVSKVGSVSDNTEIQI